MGTKIFQPQAVGWKWCTEDLAQVQVPYSLYGVGYSGPLGKMSFRVSKETRELVQWAREAEAIGARDPQTVRWLRLLGVRSELVGCPVLAYPDAFTGFSQGDGRPVLAMRAMLLHTLREEPRAAQRTLIEWFFREYPDGACVVQEHPDLELIGGKPSIRDFNMMVRALSCARFVISTRLHAGMMALAFGRPVVFLAHDTRVASFCDMLGIRSHALSRDGLGKAISSVKSLEAGDLSEMGPALKRVPTIRGHLNAFMAELTGGQTRTRKQGRESLASPSRVIALIRWLTSGGWLPA